MTAARRLHFWGYNADVLLTSAPSKHNGVIGNQLKILQKTDLKIYNQSDFDFLKYYDVVIDAMIGYILKGELRQNIIKYIDYINNSKAKVISLDIPSGINATTG